MPKYVKDKNHNRYEAYCCEDIDKRLALLEAAVADLVAGTIPDGSVTLAKLADDARSYTREINSGQLVQEWIGTSADYVSYLSQHGEPDGNIKFIITDQNAPPFIQTDDLVVGSIITVSECVDDRIFKNGEVYDGLYYYAAVGAPIHYSVKNGEYPAANIKLIEGRWRCLGATGYVENNQHDIETRVYYYIFQRIE